MTETTLPTCQGWQHQRWPRDWPTSTGRIPTAPSETPSCAMVWIWQPERLETCSASTGRCFPGRSTTRPGRPPGVTDPIETGLAPSPETRQGASLREFRRAFRSWASKIEFFRSLPDKKAGFPFLYAHLNTKSDRGTTMALRTGSTKQENRD